MLSCSSFDYVPLFSPWNLNLCLGTNNILFDLVQVFVGVSHREREFCMSSRWHCGASLVCKFQDSQDIPISHVANSPCSVKSLPRQSSLSHPNVLLGDAVGNALIHRAVRVCLWLYNPLVGSRRAKESPGELSYHQHVFNALGNLVLVAVWDVRQ